MLGFRLLAIELSNSWQVGGKQQYEQLGQSQQVGGNQQSWDSWDWQLG
jgi:hypothetical protein